MNDAVNAGNDGHAEDAGNAYTPPSSYPVYVPHPVDVRMVATGVYAAILAHLNGWTADHVMYQLAGTLAMAFGQGAPDAELQTALHTASDVRSGLDRALYSDSSIRYNSDERGEGGERADSDLTADDESSSVDHLEMIRRALAQEAMTASIAPIVRFVAAYQPQEDGPFSTDQAHEMIATGSLSFVRETVFRPVQQGEAVTLSITDGTPREEVLLILHRLVAHIDERPESIQFDTDYSQQ